MKILCYDCFAGISGDMNLAALIDLGVPVDYLRGELNKLSIGKFQLKVTREKRKGIEGTMVDVVIPDAGRASVIDQTRHAESRNWKQIKALIGSSELSENVKELSLRIFSLLARAEAKIHGVTEDEVHFHEVGAVDSIVDIVGAACCIDFLKPDRILSSPPQLGGGFVRCQHGLIPVPAPATQEILAGKPVKTGLAEFETTTPTGAAVLVALADEFVQKFELRLGKTAYGIGHRDAEHPNLLRVFWADMNDSAPAGKHFMIECTIDDMNPEWYDTLLEKLFASGADDAYMQTVIMKKSRPAVLLSVLCAGSRLDTLSQLIMNDSSSLGLRSYEVVKECLQREMRKLETKYGQVRIKLALRDGQLLRWKAEYEDCKRVAIERNISLWDVYREVERSMDGEGHQA